MNKKLLSTLIGMCLTIGLSANTYAAESEGNEEGVISAPLSELTPNEFDCTIDELELYIVKKTENLRDGTSLIAWEDFKAIKAKADEQGVQAFSTTGSNDGDTAKDAENAGSLTGENHPNGELPAIDEESEDCNMFFSELNDINMDDLEFDFSLEDIGNLLVGGVSELATLAEEQLDKLSKDLMDTVKKGMCERLSTDYLSELAETQLDKALKETGYSVQDILSEDFAEKLYKDNTTSEIQLLNVFDSDMNQKRKSYTERYINNQLDTQVDDNVNDALELSR